MRRLLNGKKRSHYGPRKEAVKKVTDEGFSVPAAAPGVNSLQKSMIVNWRKADEKLQSEIEGVDLDGGTRHSPTLALRDLVSPDQIRRATMHGSNKTFERYFRVEGQN